MKRRPISVTVIGWLYIATGAITLVFHFIQVKAWRPFPYDIILVEAVCLLAIIAGVYMLRGANWARWLALAWMAFHVALSFPAWGQVAVHSVFLAVLAFFLLRPAAAQFFHGEQMQAT